MKKLPRGVKKFIRLRKAFFRRTLTNPTELQRALGELHDKFFTAKNKDGSTNR